MKHTDKHLLARGARLCRLHLKYYEENAEPDVHTMYTKLLVIGMCGRELFDNWYERTE